MGENPPSSPVPRPHPRPPPRDRHSPPFLRISCCVREGFALNTIHFFAGGNTSAGFCSRFQDVPPPDGGKRVYFLKGGPGVGKSSFMRRVGREAEKAGLRVEYFHCSSDPDSLDGVTLPQLGAALVDGTAPHVCDPVIPGARDTLISLGDFLDTARLRPMLGELKGIQGEISARFGQCYRCLAAAGEMDRAGAEGRENPRKAHALAEEWAETLPLRGGTGRARRLFGAAFTPKGLVRLAETPWPEREGAQEGRERGRSAAENPASGLIARMVLCPSGCRPTLTLKRLSQEAVLRGLEPVELADPLLPEETLGLILPEHDLFFGAAPSPVSRDALPAETLFEPVSMGEQERKYNRNIKELLVQRAVEQLRDAKALHDELEKPYAAAMDFLKWQTTLDKVMEEIGLTADGGA